LPSNSFEKDRQALVAMKKNYLKTMGHLFADQEKELDRLRSYKAATAGDMDIDGGSSSDNENHDPPHDFNRRMGPGISGLSAEVHNFH
jgi:hypothetical protein